MEKKVRLVGKGQGYVKISTFLRVKDNSVFCLENYQTLFSFDVL